MSEKPRDTIAYADFGSHGHIFEFQSGPVGSRYPRLLHVFSERISPGLVPVRIVPIEPDQKIRIASK